MFIKREDAIKSIDDYAQDLYSHNDWKMGETADYCATLVENIPDTYVVSMDEYHKLNFKCTVMRALLMGEWVKCNDVQEALNITFNQGLKIFEFGACGPWDDHNVRFRIGEKTLEQTKMKDFEKDFKIQEAMTRVHSNPDTHQLEVLLEPHDGDI